MATKSKVDIKKLIDRVASLSEEDLAILQRIPAKETIQPAELASELYFLPSEVDDSIRRLTDSGLIEMVQSNKKWHEGEYGFTLSPKGEDAHKIIPLIESIAEEK